MKAIVVYYSLEGNTKYVADFIAKRIDADVLRIEPVKAFPTGKISKFFWGGKSVVFGQKPDLARYTFTIDNYDVVILGTPVWAGTFTPPLKTFIQDTDFKDKKIALFACSSSGNAEKCFNKVKQELQGKNVLATLSLIDPFTKKTKDTGSKIEEFCKQL